jgi:hypothetical protein
MRNSNPERQKNLMDQPNQIADAAPGFFASTLSVLLGGLAGGVAVCFVAVSTRLNDDLLLVLVGIALGVFLRWQGFAGRRAVLCAAFATALAFAYAQFLFGAVRIAQTLGLPLRDVMSKAGATLISDIAIGNLHAREWIVLGIAIALAVVTAVWPVQKK